MKKYIVTQPHLRFSCGAGEGTVNLFDGNVIFRKKDISVGSGCYTVAVSHVYTTAVEEVSSAAEKNLLSATSAKKKIFPETHAGNNWKLGIQQYIVKDAAGVYRYMDANGYLHEFASLGGEKYYASSGAGLTLTVNTAENDTEANPYLLTGDDGLSRMEFDSAGRLVRMAVKTGLNEDGTDRESVKILSYDGVNGKLTAFYDLDDVDSAGQYRKIAFTYSESGLLRSATTYRRMTASAAMENDFSAAQGGSSGIAVQPGLSSSAESLSVAQTAERDYEEIERETYVYNKKGDLIASYYTKKNGDGAEDSAAAYGSMLSAYFEYDSAGRLVLAADGSDGSAVKFAYDGDGKVSAAYNVTVESSALNSADGENFQPAEYEEAGPLLGGVLLDDAVITASAKTINDWEKACDAAGTALEPLQKASAVHYKSATELKYEDRETIATQYMYDPQEQADRSQSACYVYAMNAAGETLSVVERVKSGTITDTVSVTPDLEGTRGFRLSAPVSGSEPAFNGRSIAEVGERVVFTPCGETDPERYFFQSDFLDPKFSPKFFDGSEKEKSYIFSIWAKVSDDKDWCGSVKLSLTDEFSYNEGNTLPVITNTIADWEKAGKFNRTANFEIPVNLSKQDGWRLFSARIVVHKRCAFQLWKLSITAVGADAESKGRTVSVADMRLTEVSALPQFSSGDFLDDIASVNLDGEIFYIDQKTTYLTPQDVEKSRKNAVMAGENQNFLFVYDNGKKAKTVSDVWMNNKNGADFPFLAADFFSGITEDDVTMTTKMSYGADGSSTRR